LTKRKGSTFTAAWCLIAFVAFGSCGGVKSAFGSGRIAQTPIQKPNRKPPGTPGKSSGTVEEFSFLIKDFKLDHQGESNNLNITVQYRYRVGISNSEYPDFRPIAKDIEMFLTNYPNENDYWEILNKKITLLLLDKYPTITKFTCQIQVSPSPLVPYLRSSILTRERTIKSHSVRATRVR